MSTLLASIDVDLDPKEAFDLVMTELARSLTERGISFAPWTDAGILQGDVEIGRVTSWEPGQRLVIEWQPTEWDREVVTKLELRSDASGRGALVSLEHRNWETALQDSEAEVVGWFADEALAPLIAAMSPHDLGDWITDRKARRPTGAGSRRVYADPVYHRPNFQAILDRLGLTSDDYLLEVGCGGGAMLHDALQSGCNAAAIDHSPEMVQLAREMNRPEIESGRLEVVEASAYKLPFSDGSFTCAAMTGVFNFLDRPVEALSEICRTLKVAGKLVLFCGTDVLRGTPAAPEPIASRLHFYEDRDLERLATEAGFAEVFVDRPDLYEFAKKSGVPNDALPLFKGSGGGQLLIAAKRPK